MLNPFFLQGSKTEQSLVQDLINEQLRMYGVEVYYIPRQYITTNTVIREVIESKFSNSYPIEAYIENYEGYGDNTQILSKFGIQAQNQIILTISRERFEFYISPLIKNVPNIKLSTRPKEGDLIYFPLGDRLFEIKFVEHEKPFYQLQKTYVYTLTCELFRYEDEVVDTGIEEIDDNVDNDANIETLALVSSGSTASAFTSIQNGSVTSIIITNRGEGYTTTPIVAISSSPIPGGNAVGIATMIGGIVDCNGTTSLKVQSVQIINPGYGYTVAPGIVFIGGGGSGAAATTKISNGAIGIVTITSGGSGYVTAPSVTFSSPGIGTTAKGSTIVSTSGTVSSILITNAGSGYTSVPNVIIGSPYMIGIGTFIINETVTGSISGTTALVKNWDAPNGKLNIYKKNGYFTSGETIVGSSSSAIYQIKSSSTFAATTDLYPQNNQIENAADAILDFSESNPFGNP
jgi:hypothetical protein